MKCVICGYGIKAGQLFIPVVRALDDEGAEAPIDPAVGRLAVHAQPCPAVGFEEVIP